MQPPNLQAGQSPDFSDEDRSDERDLSQHPPQTEGAIRTWLISHLSEQLGVERADIDIQEPLASYGLSSREAMILLGDLEDFLGRQLSPTIIWEYPTIEALAWHLADAPSSPKTILETDPNRTTTTEPIAVIGLGCRFPGAQNPDAFWQLLRDGVDAITEVPAERWDLSTFYDADPATPGKMNTRWGGFLEQVDRFDPHFFGISPREAARMDPQQRLLLEVAWEALEDAGQVPEVLAGTQTGVFVGISSNDYSQFQAHHPDLIDAYAGTGNALSIAANRLSYAFDFRGPSLAVDTACSSSLVSVHLACQSLRNGESNLALAGGANVILSPDLTIAFSQARMMASDGRCKTFDAAADGYVRGEGCGMVVLKRLSDALRDGDTIRALIKGSATNQDGRSNGLTAPNGLAQQAVLHAALKDAGVAPAQIDYVEAHGTGTPLGDPIEAKALAFVLGTDRPPGSACALGSVKTNIGHLEAAAGIAALIKVVLMLQHRAIPPSLHFQTPNPHIPFDALPLRVQQTLGPWPEKDGPACAGVSSFGFGGTNAHVVLEAAPDGGESPPLDAEPAGGRAHLLSLSAHNAEALQSLARAYRDFKADAPIKHICYTAGVRRSHHRHRLALVARSRQELAERLEAFLRGEVLPGLASGQVALNRSLKLAFVFSGQGTQGQDMGRDLLESEPVFRETIERCDAALRAHANWSLLDELTADASRSRLDDTEIAQPVLFAFQVSLAELWRSWGVLPDAVVGHSLGEVTAAHLAGALSLEAAMRVVFHRGRLMQRATGQGKMAAVGLSLEAAQRALAGYEDRLSVAAINGPTSTVLSGDPAALQEVVRSLKAKQIFCRVLDVKYAFHSPQMAAFQDELVQALQGLFPQSAALPIFSTVTGRHSDGWDFNADYWGRNIREPVRLAAAVQGLAQDGYDVFLEIGPHPVLSRSVSQQLQHLGREGTVLPSLRHGVEGRRTMLGSLGALYTLGYPVEWSQLYPAGGQCVRLPTYPFQRERCWLETAEDETRQAAPPREAVSGATVHPLLGRRLRSALPIFESQLDPEAWPLLDDYRVYGVGVLPAAACVEMALAAAAEIFGGDSSALKDLVIHETPVLPQKGTQTVQAILSHQDGGEAAFQLFALAEQDTSWTLWATAQVSASPADAAAPARAPVSLQEVQARCQEQISGEAFDRRLRRWGLGYGTRARGIERIWRRDGEALGAMQLPEALASQAGAYQIHPLLLEACFRLLAAAFPVEGEPIAQGDVCLLVGVERLRVYDRPDARLWCHALRRTGEGESFAGDVRLLDASGQVVVEALGLRFQPLNRAALLHATRERLGDWLYEVAWQPKVRVEPVPTQIPPDARGRWLIFADRTGVGAALAELLRARGELCVLVFAGGASEISESDDWRIDPARPEHFERLLGETLGDDGPPCRGVVHLWSLETALPEKTTGAGLPAAQALMCGSALHLVQALAKTKGVASPRLWLVTRGAQPVGPEPTPLAVAQAPLWGVGRVVALEHPEMWGGLVDLDPGAPGDEALRLLEAVWAPGREDHLAWREGQWYVARLVRRNEGQALEEPLRLQAHGTYLITGGLGGLGLRVARWMVERGARHLVLVGRSGASGAAVDALSDLERAGAQVVVVQADVSKEDQVAELIAEIERSMPPLRGIVHAAGVLDDGVLLQQDWERFARVLAPKVEGAWNLHALTQSIFLDFFVLFSSAASLLGSPGQGNYVAANAFLDALAHHRRSQGLPALSINWGPWAEVGITATLERRWAAWGMDAMSPEQGLQALEQVLRQPTAQVGVLPIQWRKFVQLFSVGNEPPLLAELIHQTRPEQATGQPEFLRRLEQAVPGERQDLLVAHVQSQVVKVLGLDPSRPPGPQQGFFDMGMDSLMAIELKNRLQSSLGHPVALTLVFDYPTIETFARHLAQEVFAWEPPVTARTASQRDGDGQAAVPADLEQLSEKELVALLAEELETIEAKKSK